MDSDSSDKVYTKKQPEYPAHLYLLKEQLFYMRFGHESIRPKIQVH